MTAAAGSLSRSSRPTMEPLVWAFVISVWVHLTAYGGYELAKKLGWLEKDLLPAWLRRVTQVLMMEPKPVAKTSAPTQQQIPMMFVEVDPATATPDAPAKAKYYSAQNSKAANPDAHKDTETPKIDGKQTLVPKVETTPRTKAVPLQPAPEKPKPADDQAESKPKGGEKVGDLAMAKPVPKPADTPKDGDSTTTVETHVRPRTLAQAAAQQMIPGQMMKQDGGVRNQHAVSSLDAIGTPFGVYDREIVNAITQRWFALSEAQGADAEHPGEVMLQFRMHYDGRITDMKILSTTVNDIMTYMCQRAVTDPAPYRPWPMELRRLMEADYRDVTFTFYYTID